MTRKMKSIIARRLGIYKRRDNSRRGYIGNLGTGDVFVPSDNFTVYITLQTGAILEALNTRTPSIFGLPVSVGYDPYDRPNTLQVLNQVEAFGSGENASTGIANHHGQHEWPGYDTTYIWGWQWLKSLAVPVTGSLSIKVYPGEYRIGSGWKTFSQRTTIDLSSYVPTVAGKAKIVLVAVDSSGAFAVRDGVEVTGYDSLADSDIPTITAGDNVICAVKMFTGQTEIRCNQNSNDLIDLRFTGASGAASYSHARQHVITSTLDHTSTATAGRILKADANGLPVDATNTDAEVAAAVAYAALGQSAMVTENLTAQIDGVTDTFTISTWADMIYAYINWRQVDGSQADTGTDGATVTLAFVPGVDDILHANYQVPASQILTDDNGRYLVDDDGSTIFE